MCPNIELSLFTCVFVRSVLFIDLIHVVTHSSQTILSAILFFSVCNFLIEQEYYGGDPGTAASATQENCGDIGSNQEQ